MTIRDEARAHLLPHPTARHTWARPDSISEFEHFDEMPMREDGNIGDPTEQPKHRAETRAPAVTAMEWDGNPDVLIAAGTNPWLRDKDGADINLARKFDPFAVAATTECYAMCGPIPGVLAPMDDAYGVQRCDMCEQYPGDLHAALALAEHLGDGTTVWFEAERCSSSGDGLHDWGRCKLPHGHDDPHEDEEGHRWQ